jgi:peptidoglycan/LPS O-acetylase OafA/YrhL
MNHPPAVLKTRPHYQILDGLRGVAAFMVVIFHTFEAYANDNRFTQKINHGYLAVDFFFLLSGFVVAYAYDDRWADTSKARGGRMTQWEFYKRRLIRLQPMVIMGNLIGAATFYLQPAPIFPLVASTPVWKVLAVMLVGFTMIPILPSMDIRGWQEMHPLDGPAWSLFFEYLANIFYALGLRKLSNRALAVLLTVSAALLIEVAVFGPRGDVIGGARLLFPFFAGILLMRLGKRIHIKHAFPVCSLLLIALFVMPRFGGPTHLWQNGLYECLCIIILFPLIVLMGAGDRLTAPRAIRLCKFFGDISYPLYITHYPLVYIYTAWVIRDKVPAARGAVFGVLLFLTAITIAYACLKLYDEPVRAWLQRRYLTRTT